MLPLNPSWSPFEESETARAAAAAGGDGAAPAAAEQSPAAGEDEAAAAAKRPRVGEPLRRYRWGEFESDAELEERVGGALDRSAAAGPKAAAGRCVFHNANCAAPPTPLLGRLAASPTALLCRGLGGISTRTAWPLPPVRII